jgi:uncharacterized protein with HEPN domain
MSSRTWQKRIQDILQSISGIQQRIAGKSLQEIQHDETFTKAILYDFMVLEFGLKGKRKAVNDFHRLP